MNIELTSNAFIAVLQRDLTLGMRHRAELVNPLLFYLIVVMMFPLAIGPNQEILGCCITCIYIGTGSDVPFRF
jgi:heme exporter protein B